MGDLFSLSELPETTTSLSRKVARKKIRSKYSLGKRFQKAQEVIGTVEQDETIHYVSAGEWSMHDLLFHLLQQTGPANVYVASWSLSEDPCRQLIKRVDIGAIKNLFCVFDWRIKIRCPNALQLAKHNASNVHLTTCHAKATVIQNEHWGISIVGSANYTNNPRIEAGIICTDNDSANFHKKWIQDTIDKSDPFELAKK